MITTVFNILVLLILLNLVDMKPTGANRQDRAWKMKKSSCESEDCSHLVPEEAYNCVNECVSPDCFQTIYSSNPLEDGEIDPDRNRQFIQCIRQEYRQKVSQN